MNTTQNVPISHVELGITGKHLVPNQITALLGMSPTRSFTKGDIDSGHRVKRPWGLWAITFQGTDVQEDAARLLDAVRGKEAVLRALVETQEVEVSIGIWWEPEEGQGGFTLDSAIFVQLCAVSTRINVYFPGHR